MVTEGVTGPEKVQKGRKTMKIRWLGEFVNCASLHDALMHEISRPMGEWGASEPLFRGRKPRLGQCTRVGLVAKSTAVKAVFCGDAYSERDRESRKLFTHNRPSEKGTYGEAFVAPRWVAIALRGRVSNKTWKTVQWFSKQYGLPIVRMEDYNGGF